MPGTRAQFENREFFNINCFRELRESRRKIGIDKGWRFFWHGENPALVEFHRWGGLAVFDSAYRKISLGGTRIAGMCRRRPLYVHI